MTVYVLHAHLSAKDVMTLPNDGWEARGTIMTIEGEVRLSGPCDIGTIANLKEHFANRIDDGKLSGQVLSIFSDAMVLKFEGEESPPCYIAVRLLKEAA